MEFDVQHDSSENFQIIERRKAIVLHPDGHHDHVNCARSFCACWVSSLHHSDIDVGLLPCLLNWKSVYIQYYLANKLIESQFRELILKWVPPPLETLNTEFSDQQWLYDRGPLLRIDINKKTSAARSDHLCYPYTTLF
ncbi:hypothetical protein M0R45_007290 [Rubus argutus]|uniref:Uncharacterized protein n=1 Tax=Rubus argutus TaxID=59490 RepID=A0AAW1XY12_RUBAR